MTNASCGLLPPRNHRNRFFQLQPCQIPNYDALRFIMELVMWTCQCGEQIEDQFDECWRCAGPADDESEKWSGPEPQALKCQRCHTRLEYLGKKPFHIGGEWTSKTWREFFDHHETFDLYICLRCGHVEFFLAGIGEELRPNGDMEDDNTGDAPSPVRQS